MTQFLPSSHSFIEPLHKASDGLSVFHDGGGVDQSVQWLTTRLYVTLGMALLFCYCYHVRITSLNHGKRIYFFIEG